MKRMCLSLIGDICFPEEFKQIFTLDGKFLILCGDIRTKEC